MNDTQSPQAGSGKVEVTLLDILKLLLSKSYWLLLAGVLAGACVFLVTTFLITPSYESRVSFYVYNSSNNSVQSGTINNGDLQAAESLATTYSKILASNSILDAVLQEIPRVRKDSGYPPLVTPTSQIVGTQAGMNVLFGRYKTFPNESKGLLRGEYGKLPAPVNEEVRKMAIGNDKVITCRPADLLKPEMDKYREEIRDQATCEEDVLSYALFPKVAPKFFEYRSAHQTKIDSTMLNKDNKTMPV